MGLNGCPLHQQQITPGCFQARQNLKTRPKPQSEEQPLAWPFQKQLVVRASPQEWHAPESNLLPRLGPIAEEAGNAFVGQRVADETFKN